MLKRPMQLRPIARSTPVAHRHAFLLRYAPSTLGSLPRAPLATKFTSHLASKVPNAIFATNPCRVRFYAQEIVIFRDDILKKMQRHYKNNGYDTICMPASWRPTSGEGWKKILVLAGVVSRHELHGGRDGVVANGVIDGVGVVVVGCVVAARLHREHRTRSQARQVGKLLDSDFTH